METNDDGTHPAPITTFSYRRNDLYHNPRDSYNPFLAGGAAGGVVFSPTTTLQRFPTEYWTNGTTTYLVLSPSSSSSSMKSSSDGPSAAEQQQQEQQHGRHGSQPTTTPTTDSHHHKDDNVVRHSLIAGSVSGMASTFLLYPLELVRVKSQAPSSLSSSAGGGSGQHRQRKRSRALGPIQIFRNTIRHGGLSALYTGMSLPLMAQALYKSSIFTCNNLTERAIINWRTFENLKLGSTEEGRLTVMDRFWCGFLGGAVNALLFGEFRIVRDRMMIRVVLHHHFPHILTFLLLFRKVTPIEFVRTQMIAQHSKLAAGQEVTRMMGTSLDVVRHSVRDHGLFSLWRGASLSVAR